MRGALLGGYREWYCPACKLTDRTPLDRPNRWHSCSAAAGFPYVPMVPVGVKAKVVINRPEDYVGTERIRRDGNGVPVASVNIVRDQGQDAVAFAGAGRAVVPGLRDKLRLLGRLPTRTT